MARSAAGATHSGPRPGIDFPDIHEIERQRRRQVTATLWGRGSVTLRAALRRVAKRGARAGIPLVGGYHFLADVSSCDRDGALRDPRGCGDNAVQGFGGVEPAVVVNPDDKGLGLLVQCGKQLD